MTRIPGYIKRQMPIPGLEAPEKTRPKPLSLKDQVKALESRVLQLELELSLMRILMERGER